MFSPRVRLQKAVGLLREQHYLLGVWQQQVQYALSEMTVECAQLGHAWVKERDSDGHSLGWV
jgi:hypothetical protein